MLTMKNIIRLIVFCIFSLGFVACEDEGSNPSFAPGEVYIYTDMPQTLNTTAGVQTEWAIVVSPNDGSVSCRWLLNGAEISNQKDLSHTFTTNGTFTLRFEAIRDGVVNYREFSLTVSPAS